MLREMLQGWRQVGVGVLFAVSLMVGGCGSDDSSDTTTRPEGPTAGGATTTGGGGGGGDGTVELKPLSPPVPEESIKEAEKRISDLLEAGNCERIAELSPLSRTAADADVEARCNLYETRLRNAEPTDSEEFGRGGGVIDYESPAGEFSALMVLDSDGLYHIAFVDPFLGEASVGSKPADEWDKVVDSALEAMRDRDCDAYLKVANRRFGPGALDKSAACDYVDANPIADLYEANPDAEPEELGANADYAIHGIAGPGAFYALLLARESDANLPENAEPLPKDAPEYSFAGAIRTNVRGGENSP